MTSPRFEPGETAAFKNTNVGEKGFPSDDVEVVEGPDAAGSYMVRYISRRNPGDDDWMAFKGELTKKE